MVFLYLIVASGSIFGVLSIIYVYLALKRLEYNEFWKSIGYGFIFSMLFNGFVTIIFIDQTYIQYGWIIFIWAVVHLPAALFFMYKNREALFGY